MIEESNIQWHIIGPSLVVEIDRLKAENARYKAALKQAVEDWNQQVQRLTIEAMR